MAERRFEFGLEGLRYWDLIRQDLSTAAAAIDNVDTKVDDDDFNIKFRAETRGFFAIPESEITLSNGVLKQNPGWN
jgi:hypothetical protein